MVTSNSLPYKFRYLRVWICIVTIATKVSWGDDLGCQNQYQLYWLNFGQKIEMINTINIFLYYWCTNNAYCVALSSSSEPEKYAAFAFYRTLDFS